MSIQSDGPQTYSGEMNDMRRLHLLKELLCRLEIPSLNYQHSPSKGIICQVIAPQISILRARKHPSLSRLSLESRVAFLVVDDVLDAASYKAVSTRYKDCFRHEQDNVMV